MNTRGPAITLNLHLVAGGAGFIGVNLVQALLDGGERVLVVDDLSRGGRELVEKFCRNSSFELLVQDCSDAVSVAAAIECRGGVSDVWHLAANSDISAGVADPNVDLQRTFMTTFGLLEAMRHTAQPARLHFASSSAVYGDHGSKAIEEDTGPLEPISNYGAMKLASEGLIRAAVEAWLPRASIFRFPNVIGAPATHGVIYDFCQKLKATPDRLTVLGDGSQQKTYLHVADLIDAMLHVADLPGTYRVFNIGPQDEGVTVRAIAERVRDCASPAADIMYGTEARGWVGDVPRFRYSVARLSETGWRPTMSSDQAVARAVDEIVSQEFGG